jgi:hypothetical protein
MALALVLTATPPSDQWWCASPGVQEIFKIEGVWTADELSDVWQHLRTPEAQQKFEAAATNLQGCNLPHWENVRNRIQTKPPFHSLWWCKKKRCRVQASAFPDMIHKDTASYDWRMVFRFPADGLSTTKLDLHAGLQTGPFASVLIKPGQVR